MVTYTIRQYIESADSLASKILAIDNLIDAMILSMADAIGNSGTASYSFDDGQTKISTEYRSVSDIKNGISALEQMKQVYVNRYNGRVSVLRGRLNY